MLNFTHKYFVVVAFLGGCLTWDALIAQDENQQPTGVVIERSALTILSPEKFTVSLKLKPVRSLPIVAPTDGIVKNVLVKVGDQVAQHSELIRLDSQEYSLSLKKAQAELNLAKLVLQLATDKDAKISEAKLNVAQKELDLAQFRFDQTILHSAIEGVITELYVTQGQYVRAGDLLATVIDPQQLFALIPVERDQVDAGNPFPLTIESKVTNAKVDAILPPLEEFDPLRELFVSVATARLLVDSNKGEFTTGQSVASKLVPRFPISEIQILAIHTATESPDAERSVQVIRDGFVRSLPVQVLGQVGQTHVFVSARFVAGDELIVSSSEPLKDGSWVRPLLVQSPENQPNNSRNMPRPNALPPSGF